MPMAAHTRSRSRSRSRHWQWLLLIPTAAPLLTPFTNRIEPTLLGVPFFFWYQFACALLATVVITVVYLATRGERP
jgi:dolichyl-phosphate-mannose--protein O-mannosyl transferase